MNTSDTHNNNTESTSSSSSTSGNNSSIIMQQSNVFRSQRSFLQWEGAVELHAACLDQVDIILCLVFAIICDG